MKPLLRFAIPSLALTLAAGTALAQSAASPTAVYTPQLVFAARNDLPALRACYEGARAESHRAWDHLRSISIVVNPDGSIGPVSARGATAPALQSCVLPVVARWHVAPPANGAPVTLTYTRATLRSIARLVLP